MAENEHPIAVENDQSAKRFQAQVGDYLAFIQYEYSSKQIVFTHTVVPEALAGQGVGSHLARTALDYARSHQLKVVPLCPFVAEYIRRHTEYEELVHHHRQE